METSGVSWRLENSNEPGIVLVGNPDCRRVALFQQALVALRRPPACVLPWADLLAGQAHPGRWVRRGDIVRIESPGRNFEVERALLRLGSEMRDSGASRRLSRAEVDALVFDRGRILFPRQWYLGFRRALDRLRAQLADCPPHRLMQHPADIAVMFDKPRCHARLQAAGVPVPASLGAPRSYAEFLARLKGADCSRAFVKLAHGSSASGIVAFRRGGARVAAYTTVEVVIERGDLRLYNTRKLRVLREETEVARLLDALCSHGVHVEEWLPKADLHGRTFDARIVVIDGRACQAVLRLSRGPITNLHLLNDRAHPDALARRAPDAWRAACRACERVMRSFPGSLYGGVDLLFTPGLQRYAVLEVNAFGDLLPGVLHGGRDTYRTELDALLAPAPRRTPMETAP
jgi:hypothetical protein